MTRETPRDEPPPLLRHAASPPARVDDVDTTSTSTTTHDEPCSSSSSSDRHVPQQRAVATVRRVPIDVIVARIAPLTALRDHPDKLHALCARYDDDHVGALSEAQWARFCRDHSALITSLGEEMHLFDESGDYTIVTVEHAYDIGHRSHHRRRRRASSSSHKKSSSLRDDGDSNDADDTARRAMRDAAVSHTADANATTTMTSSSSSCASVSVTQRIVRFLEGFVAGGVAGAVSKTVIAPGDRLKIIFQVDSTRPFSLRSVLHLGVQTVRDFGLTGLWIGNGATMLRVVPYAAITYASFDAYYQATCRVWLCRYRSSSTYDEGDASSSSSLVEVPSEAAAVYLRFVSGALAGATATTCTYPLDLMRARFAAHSSAGKTRFPSYRHAFRDATAQHGVRSLYAGLMPTLVGIVPYAGCSFACFETIKRYLVVLYALDGDKGLATWQRMLAGGLAGLLAQSLTYPLDIVRRRMQVTPGRYHSVQHALRQIARDEGVRRGMYKGLSMNWIKGPIATATSFTVNDLIKRRSRRYHSSNSNNNGDAVAVVAPARTLSVAELCLCGGCAAGVAKLVTLPFDWLQMMYQLGLADAEKATAQQGVTQLLRVLRAHPNVWTSAHVTMMRVVPYGALTYSLFDVFQAASQRVLYSHDATPLTNFVAGAAAAAVGTLVVYPLDLLRTRVAASARPGFSSYFWVLRAMQRRLGVGALYEGCYLAMTGVSVLAGIGFALYEYLRARFACETFAQRLAAGMVAGIAGQAVTYPLHVVRRCRQAERVAYTRLTTRPLRALLQQRGMYAVLYRKMPFSWTLNSLMFGISFAINDACKELVLAARRDILHDIVFANAASTTTTMSTRA